MLFITVQVEPFVFLLCVAVKMEFISFLSTVLVHGVCFILGKCLHVSVFVHAFQSVKGEIFVHLSMKYLV